jgi:nitroimidazol reductase NimA-like FMN-containing flavoprotein (pyridoxamine 5'-phosphate oxidase superfamily)
MMYETDADVAALQELLDRSYQAAGPHLRRITTPQRRVAAADLCERLTGMVLLVLATVSAEGRPVAGPIDGIFYRGAFHFGTAPDAVRARHMRARPQVSATHVPREEFAVTAHGRAEPVDVREPEGKGLRDTLLEIYVPRYGPEWEHFIDPPDSIEEAPIYFRLAADRMFSFQMIDASTSDR